MLDANRAGIVGLALEISKPGTALHLDRTTRADGFSEDLDTQIPVLPPDQRLDVAGAYALRLTSPGPLSAIKDLLVLSSTNSGRHDMANKSGSSSQAVTLPRGGGALQGIGETFSPDLFTGTGNSTVPLDLPSGRNGFQPQLALGYSTGNGGGPFGLGWALSLPGVSRKTAKGVPRYRDDAADAEERDTLILSGAEDLVPVSEPAPGVTRYRPRTEGMFARIDPTAGRGRRLLARGQSERTEPLRHRASAIGRSRRAGRSLGSRAYLCLEARRDRRLFRQPDRVPLSSRSRHRGLTSGTESYPEEIRYADFEESGQIRFLVSVRFVYEERPDPFSECRAGFELRTRLRCKRIEIRTHADQDRLLRTYRLEYVDQRVRAGELPPASLPPNSVSLLSRIRVVGHDGSATQTLPPMDFGYTDFTPQRQTFRPVEAVDRAMPSRSLADHDFEMVSLFGNGLPDIVQLNGTARVGAIWAAARSTPPNPWARSPPEFACAIPASSSPI